MIKVSTLKKIYDLEYEHGSLINAYENCTITYSTYYRYKQISLTESYSDYFNINKQNNNFK